MRLSYLAIALAIAVLVSACGSSSDSQPTAQQSKPAAGPDAISINDFKFIPGTLDVKAGAKVTVTNSDSTTHTLTADGGAFDTGDLDPDASKTITLSKAGRFPYHCQIHTFMKGTIVVS